ncbi:MAG: tRNA (N6-isopentenyl adenosine(37)-C2)-methylthiotransferase MiaB [Bacteroidia bacterium]|nr:MAG: tRNA (N6-isopentenyl adenosine(37)-C2)-methylthiotransferase MiaB [Bacteroidia bacterium]
MSTRKLYIETYGCQMNVVDSEVVAAILQQHNYQVTEELDEADLVLVNTCSIRDNAEQRVRARIREFGRLKEKSHSFSVGVIGCMAERLKEKLLEEENTVDLVVGPDSYRDLPALLQEVESGQKGINTLLSLEETYGDIRPVRMDRNHVTSFVAIMRGCNNFCSYCVVPGTRGRERSRDPETVVRECKELFEQGYREVTLLGQNVNSYRWKEGEQVLKFEKLLERVAKIHPLLRVRFATSHPKDMSDHLLKVIAKFPNLCQAIHLPLQSGSTSVLGRMKRRYTREQYMERIQAIRKFLPGATISTDIIAGFCGETEEEHQQTLSLMEWAGYDFAYMFKYSERPETFAAEKLNDDVPEEVKSRRLNEIIVLQSRLSLRSKERDLGQTYEVLEGPSKKSDAYLYGRTSQNKVVVFPKGTLKQGDYARVVIKDCTSATLKGNVVS